MSDLRPKGVKPNFSCTECGLCDNARRPVWGRGPKKPLFMLVGEGPGETEDQSGKPFDPTAPAGRLITNVLKSLGVSRKEIYITNATRCFKGYGGKITAAHIKACKKYLLEEIEKVDPEYIVLAGNEACKSMLNHEGILKIRGTMVTGADGRKYFPILHPASALPSRSPEYRKFIRDDLSNLLRMIRKGGNILDDLDIKIVKTWKQFKRLHREMLRLPRGTVVAHDFETNSLESPFHNPNFLVSGMSVAWDRNGGWYLPLDHQNPVVWTPEQRKKILAFFLWFARTKRLRKLAHNWIHEYKVWLGHFHVVVQNIYSDTMLESHFILSETGIHGLDKLAWKVGMGGYDDELEQYFTKLKIKVRDYSKVLLKTLGRYSVGDSVCTYRSHLKQIKKIKKRGQGKVYFEHLMPGVKVYADIESRGQAVDKKYVKRLGKFYAKRIKKMEMRMCFLASVPRNFNFNSSDQLAKLLVKWCKFDIREVSRMLEARREKKKSDGYSRVARKLAAFVGEQRKPKNPDVRMISPTKRGIRI